MIESIDGSSVDPQTPFCQKCLEQIKAKTIADFHEERRNMTMVARARGWTDEDISEIRMELRDQLYEKLKVVDKPLPPLPGGEESTSSRG